MNNVDFIFYFLYLVFLVITLSYKKNNISKVIILLIFMHSVYLVLSINDLLKIVLLLGMSKVSFLTNVFMFGVLTLLLPYKKLLLLSLYSFGKHFFQNAEYISFGPFGIQARFS